MMLRNCLPAVLLALVFAGPARARDEASGFAIRDKPGDHLDVLLDGKLVARYQYAHDTTTAKRRDETYKPYLHVFDPEGKAPLTKGPGGLFPHHRGIFVGWMKIGHNGKTYDRWHMKGGEIVHEKFLGQQADRDHATFTSLCQWNDNAGKPILEEERTTTVRRGPAPWRLLIDFTTKLKAVNGPVSLDGDPEHSGVQFRPANEVVKKETLYVFPGEKADPKKDVDYPWVGETFTLRGRQHSVVEMNHPDNPKKTRWSAYRDYGRFGAFPKAEVRTDRPLVLRYEFALADGPMPPAAAIQKEWDRFAGARTPSPAPRTTIRHAAGMAAPKKKGGK